MTRNAELFRDVATTIREERARWDQSGYTDASGPADLDEVYVAVRDTPILCASSQCVAGWAVALNGDKQLLLECTVGAKDFHNEAASILGLDEAEADFLFLDVQTTSVNLMANTLTSFALGADLDDIRDAYNDEFQG